MRIKSIMILACFVVLAAVVVAAAAKLTRKTENVAVEGAKNLNVECTFGAGTLNITPVDIADAARLDIEYDPDKVDYHLEYEVDGGTGYLEMKSELDHHVNLDNTHNRWDLGMSTRYPQELKMEIGACEADMDLGGIPITNLKLEIGAASGQLDFSKENPERCRLMRIEAGASSLKLSNLGNAAFDDFKFSGGAGSFDMDFRGTYHGESMAKLEIGLGSVDITLPKGLPVRIEADENWFSSIDLHGKEISEVHKGVYESDDFGSAKDRLVLSLEVGMGSADLYWK